MINHCSGLSELRGRHPQTPKPDKKATKTQSWGLVYRMEKARALMFPFSAWCLLSACSWAELCSPVALPTWCETASCLATTTTSSDQALPTSGHLTCTSSIKPMFKMSHSLTPALHVSNLYMYCELMFFFFFLEEESSIMSATFIYSRWQVVLWGISF